MSSSPSSPPTPNPRGLRSPLGLSPNSTLVDELTPVKSRQPISITERSKLDEVFDIHDLLVNEYVKRPSGQKMKEIVALINSDISDFTKIVSLGGQSAGKSTVLSQITNIPLWSSGGRATVCPTQIHSRYRPFEAFTARIEIQIARPVNDHVPSRIAFTTQPLTDIGRLKDAMRMAGLQAKHFGDGSHGLMTTYQEMMDWDSTQLDRWLDEQSRSREGLRFTDNIVVLHVSGPAQSNLSIIDMPGLVGDPFVRSMVEVEIAKPSNLILCCAPGSGRDISIEDIEFSLIQKHDPQAKRSIFVVTKADRMDSVEAFEDRLGYPDSDPNWTLKPAHGWWFVSPRTDKEDQARTHDALVRLREEALFRESKWDKLKEIPSFHHGTTNLRKFVYGLFSDLVVKHVDSLKQVLKTKTLEIEARLALLPAEIKEPLEEVHLIVDSLSQSIQEALTQEREHSRRPYELQRNLPIKLGATLPLFMPFRQSDSEHPAAADFVPLSSPITGAGRQIFMNEVYDFVHKYTPPRDRILATYRVKPHFVIATAGEWGEVCQSHVKNVWMAVMESVEQIVDESCGHPTLANRAKSILRDKAEEFIERCLKFSEHYCKGELEDPNLVDIPANGAVDRDPLIESYSKVYHEIYTSDPSTPNDTATPPVPRTSNTSDTAIADADAFGLSANSPLSQTRSTDPASTKWPPPELDRRWCFYLMAASTVWLQAGVNRLAMNVGRLVQTSVRDFLKEISSTLRRELGLVKVSLDVEEETRRLLEPDEKVVMEREGLKKRKREFEIISAKFKRVHS